MLNIEWWMLLYCSIAKPTYQTDDVLEPRTKLAGEKLVQHSQPRLALKVSFQPSNHHEVLLSKAAIPFPLWKMIDWPWGLVRDGMFNRSLPLLSFTRKANPSFSARTAANGSWNATNNHQLVATVERGKGIVSPVTGWYSAISKMPPWMAWKRRRTTQEGNWDAIMATRILFTRTILGWMCQRTVCVLQYSSYVVSADTWI